MRRSTWMLVAAAVITVTAIAAGSLVLSRLQWEARGAGRGTSALPSTVSAANPLVVGIARTPGGPSEWISFAKVFAQLQRDLGRRVIIRYGPAEQQAALLRSGDVDLALVSVRQYLQLQREEAATLVVTPVIREQRVDVSVIVVAEDSEALDLDDLRGKKLVIADALAGEGFVHWLLEEREQNADEFFLSVAEIGKQDQHLTMVSKGEADATSVRRSSLARWPQGVFRIIETSPPYGMPPLVARKGLDEATVRTVRESLVAAASRGVLPAASSIDGFAPAVSTDYEFARVLEDALMRHENDEDGLNYGGFR